MVKKKVVDKKDYELDLSPDELDAAIGRAMREFFILYKGDRVDYLTAGSRKGTDELTIVVRPDGKAPVFCTFTDYEEVAECFITVVTGMMVEYDEYQTKLKKALPF